MPPSTPGDVRPFALRIPEAELDDLRGRLLRTRLPEPETVADASGDDWSQGPPLAYVSDLCGYWAEEYDWRRLESELNDHGQSRMLVDGVDVHFLHVVSPRRDAHPLVLSHGWPGSVVEALEVMDALAHPPRQEIPAFHVVAPSLPGFGFSAKPPAEAGRWTGSPTHGPS